MLHELQAHAMGWSGKKLTDDLGKWKSLETASHNKEATGCRLSRRQACWSLMGPQALLTKPPKLHLLSCVIFFSQSETKPPQEGSVYLGMLANACHDRTGWGEMGGL